MQTVIERYFGSNVLTRELPPVDPGDLAVSSAHLLSCAILRCGFEKADFTIATLPSSAVTYTDIDSWLQAVDHDDTQLGFTGALPYHTGTCLDPAIHAINGSARPYGFQFSACLICSEGRTWLISVESGSATTELLLDWHSRALDVNRPSSCTGNHPATANPLSWSFSMSDEQYQDQIAHILRDIADGRYYELNFTQRFSVESSVTPAELFRKSAELNGRFSAYLTGPTATLVSASPELLMYIDSGIIATAPIKGSRKRGGTPDEDNSLVNDLRRSHKDHAEHTMVIDLARNDIGKICTAGSVRVQNAYAVETLPRVHHLVSHVTGSLLPRISTRDIFTAMFPAASITGAPKIEVSKAICQYEMTTRGYYTGSIGFSTRTGIQQWNVAIRTVATEPSASSLEGSFTYTGGSGGAIVADSIPCDELAECRMKAAPFLEMLASCARR